MQVPAALEVRGLIEPVARREHRELLCAQLPFDVAAIPDVELAFVTLGVGVEAREVAALRSLHLAQGPGGGLLRHARVQRIAAGERRLRIHRQQRAVVVEHFLEVRNHPALIDRVAAESATQLIVDAALGHAAQREGGHVEGLQIGLGRMRTGAPVAQQPLETLRVREFGRGAEAAVAAVEGVRQLRAAGLERLIGELGVGGRRRRIELGECRHQRVVLRAQLRGMIAIVFRHPQQHVAKRRQAVAGFLREVGAAEERPLVVVRQEHGERPAAAVLGEHLLRDLVDPVDVRTLFPIDLDVDEVLVEKPCGGLVFEALFPQSVAPMTRVVSYTQVNRLFFGACPLERLGSPRIPLHRIVRVFPQVRTRLGREIIRVLRRAVGVDVARLHP